MNVQVIHARMVEPAMIKKIGTVVHVQVAILGQGVKQVSIHFFQALTKVPGVPNNTQTVIFPEKFGEIFQFCP